MDTLFADVNDSEDPFAEQKSTQEPKKAAAASTQDVESSQDPITTLKPDQASLTTKEGTHVDEDELIYSAELTYEQRKELRLKKRNKKATEESKPSKPPKPAHLTKEAQKAGPSPRLAPKKPHEDRKLSPLPPSKYPHHKKDQEKSVTHSPASTRPAHANKANSHAHLEYQNQQLSEELGKLRDEARRLEKKLEEKDHKICELKAEISSLTVEDNDSDTDDKITAENSVSEEQQGRDDSGSTHSSDHHGDDSGNDTKGNTTPESDHHGDRHNIQSPDNSNQVKHDVDYQGNDSSNHENHEHVHHADQKISSGRHSNQKASGHSTHKRSQETHMSNPWKASKKSHMV